MYKELDVLQVNQPFGTFFVAILKAKELLELTFTNPIRYENGRLTGSQRILDEEKRVKEIKQYVEGVDAAIPNSIILAANYDESGLSVEDENLRWKINGNKLLIPKSQKLASIIDGQHRVFGFEEANENAQEIELVCSIYLDLPNALQAYLFATINSTQKKVDKSLAYEQFGFNIDNEDSQSWSPDKLAIAFYKQLNESSESPFFRHIKIAPQIDELLKTELKESKWLISTATVVDGIIRLFSTNPKLDKYTLQKVEIKHRKRSNLSQDKSPLRKLYLEDQDIVIYKIICNFFISARELLIDVSEENSYIKKTVGIQALFDFLRLLLTEDISKDPSLTNTDLSKNRFFNNLKVVSEVDFSDNYFQASGVGRSRVRNLLLYANNMLATNKHEDIVEMDRILKKQINS